jgi:hypothetical protein
VPEHFRDLLARRLAVEQLHGAPSAEAVGAQARDVHPDGGEGVCRQGQEDLALHARLQVGRAVQAGELPLAVERQAVDRQAQVVQGPRQGPDVGWPGGELDGPPADLPRRQGRPKPGGQLGEDRMVQRSQPGQAEPDPLEEREGARTGVRRVGEDRGLAREPGVRLRAEDGQVDEIRKDVGIANLSFLDVVEAEGGAREHGGAAKGLLPGPLPDRQGCRRPAG